MLKVLYVIALGLLFTGVVGFGFAAFYPAPQFPETPETVRKALPDSTESAEERAAQEKYDADVKAYQEVSQTYNRNLAIGLIITALIIMTVSILWLGKIDVIGDGLTLGGVFTLLYGLGRAMAAGDDKIRFVAVLFGLAVLLFLTYWKYIRPQKENSPAL